ncbi:MAG: hypothetical protein M3401_07470, partial [Actinomycetota bacterium]|nr:hypothetical protein [Actinomycetota bacterium]
MLFDLRGRGRRRTVQAIYLTLALLLGVGLVGLGIGSNTSGGGILDALKGDGGANSSPDEGLDKELKRAAQNAKANPKDPAVWAELTRLRFRRANLDGFTTDKARPRLELASQSWERYLALDPKKPNAGLASTMVRVYGEGLNEPVKAVRAMEILTAETKPPNARLYARLAQLAYAADEKRVGNLAADRAVELAKPEERKALRAALDAAKTTGAQG